MECSYCHNVEVEVPKGQHRLDVICQVCAAIIDSNLKVAQTFFRRMSDQVRFCNGYLIVEETPHLNFYGKHFDCRYPTNIRARCKDGSHVSVDMGVAFYDTYARCFYTQESYAATYSASDSEEYGPQIHYEDPQFWLKLWELLDQAAEYAWKVGLRTCEYCDCHFIGECHCRAKP